MTKESLMEMGLSEQQAGEVMKQVETTFVPKTSLEEVNRELQAAKRTIKERDGQLEELKKSTGDVEGLKQQITQLQTDNANQQKQHEEEMKAIRMGNAVDRALSQAHAINAATVKPLLAAFLDKATLAEDGTIPGLVEEIGKLAKGADTSFLFKAETNPTPAVSGASPAGSVTAPPDARTTGYEARLADARKAGNSALAVAIKREAAAEGIQLF